MDCSAFHRHHVAYVDDTLPHDLVVAAARHAAECAACARHDAAVRRSLLLARNLATRAPLTCSADFAARLEARLRAECGTARGAARGASVPPDAMVPGDDWTPSWREVVAESAVGRVGGRLPAVVGHRRVRQGLAAAAVLATLSAGSLLRSGEPEGQMQGLGGGPLAAAPWGGPFGTPFAPVSVDDGTLGTASDLGYPAGRSGYAPVGLDMAAELAEAGPTLVVLPGDMDAAALVAPAAVGVPVWAAAVLAGEGPAVLWRAGGDPSIELVRVGH